jgi:hypothetical protein
MGGIAKQRAWIAKGCKAVTWAQCNQSWATEHSGIAVSSEAVSLSLLLEPWWMMSSYAIGKLKTVSCYAIY